MNWSGFHNLGISLRSINITLYFVFYFLLFFLKIVGGAFCRLFSIGVRKGVGWGGGSHATGCNQTWAIAEDLASVHRAQALPGEIPRHPYC